MTIYKLTRCLSCGEFDLDGLISQDNCDNCLEAMEEDG
jgi:hypothetical protein